MNPARTRSARSSCSRLPLSGPPAGVFIERIQMRWFWVDKFTEFKSGSHAKAIKNVSLSEDHLHDHLPGFPIMPASLMLEGMAQTGGILLGKVNDFSRA